MTEDINITAMEKQVFSDTKMIYSLATFGHEGERTSLLFRPIASDERMSKVVVANRFDVNDINEVSKRTRADDGSQLFVVRRVSQN